MRLHRLDLNHLITLETLLIERNLTRAAKRLFVTQPALSNALATLRKHFNDELLVRQGRRMVCTPFALSLFEPLSNALSQLREVAMAKAQFDPSTTFRNLRIAASDYVTSVFLGEVLCHIKSIAPNVTITHVPLCAEAFERFENGEVDAVICPDGRAMVQAFPKETLFLDRFVCVAANSNRSVGANLSLEELCELPRVSPPYKEFWLNNYLKPLSHRAPNKAGPSLPFSGIPWLVARSNFVSCIPERLMELYETVLPLRRVDIQAISFPEIKFVLQWRPETAKDPFADWLLEQFQFVSRSLERRGRHAAFLPRVAH